MFDIKEEEKIFVLIKSLGTEKLCRNITFFEN